MYSHDFTFPQTERYSLDVIVNDYSLKIPLNIFLSVYSDTKFEFVLSIVADEIRLVTKILM